MPESILGEFVPEDINGICEIKIYNIVFIFFGAMYIVDSLEVFAIAGGTIQWELNNRLLKNLNILLGWCLNPLVLLF